MAPDKVHSLGSQCVLSDDCHCVMTYKNKVQIYASEQQFKMFVCSNLHFADTISKMWTSLKR